MTIPNDWGVPDWCDAGAYPLHSGKGAARAWAWEFLRRNAEYRRVWTERVLPFVTSDGLWVENDADGNSPGLMEGEALGLPLGFHDPRKATAPLMFSAGAVRSVRGVRIAPAEGEPGAPIKRTLSLDIHEVAYVFDLSRPLEIQFERALKDAKSLRSYRESKKQIVVVVSRSRSDKYVLYLRIIDGEDAGASRSEIVRVLFESRAAGKSAREIGVDFDNHRDAAHKLRDDGYHALAAGRD